MHHLSLLSPLPPPPQHSSHAKYGRSSHRLCAYFLIIYIWSKNIVLVTMDNDYTITWHIEHSKHMESGVCKINFFSQHYN